MTITNGYATSAQFFAFALPDAGTSSGDDAVIEQIIESASRVIDTETRRTFYARAETRYYDVPTGNTLELDDDLISIGKLTNGDGTEITAGDYLTKPYNESPKYAIKIKDVSNVTFEFDSTTNGEKAISVSGSWGWSSSVPKDIEVATLELAKNIYNRRQGQGDNSETVITPSGIIISPKDIPASVRSVIKKYQRFA